MVKIKVRKMQNGSPLIYNSFGSYNLGMTAENLKTALNEAGIAFLKGLGTVGKIITAPLVYSDPSADIHKSPELLKLEKALQAERERLVQSASTWVSPLNYGAALFTGNGLNARKGEEVVSSWEPAWLAIGRAGEILATPKIVKGTASTTKAIASTPRMVVNAAKALVKNAKVRKVAKEFEKNVDQGPTPDLNSRDYLYRTTTPKEVSTLQSGQFEIRPTSANHGAYGWRRGAPFYRPGSLMERRMIAGRNGLPEDVVANPSYLLTPVSEGLRVRVGSGGTYGDLIPSTDVWPSGMNPYLRSGSLYFPEESSVAFLPGDVLPEEMTAWNYKNGGWEFENITKPKVIDVSDSQPTVNRTSAKGFKEWIEGDPERDIKPIASIDDPNSAFIELRSREDGHATVAKRHLTDSNGKDITFTFDKGLKKDNLLQLEFDDSHGNKSLSLSEVEQAVNGGMWKGSEVAEHPRPLTFRDMTPEQAEQLVDFVDKHKGKNIYVHCLRGTSRSGAVDKFLEDFYGYKRPSTKNTKGYSKEVYQALQEAYTRKHRFNPFKPSKDKQGGRLKGKNRPFVKGVSILDSNPDAYKDVKRKMRKAANGYKFGLSDGLALGSLIIGSAINSSLLNKAIDSQIKANEAQLKYLKSQAQANSTNYAKDFFTKQFELKLKQFNSGETLDNPSEIVSAHSAWDMANKMSSNLMLNLEQQMNLDNQQLQKQKKSILGSALGTVGQFAIDYFNKRY